jgi:hypothetical protein
MGDGLRFGHLSIVRDGKLSLNRDFDGYAVESAGRTPACRHHLVAPPSRRNWENSNDRGDTETMKTSTGLGLAMQETMFRVFPDANARPRPSLPSALSGEAAIRRAGTTVSWP